MEERHIGTALISVFDKSGLDSLVGQLVSLQVGLISTGGTAEYIRGLGVEVDLVEDLTSYPAILGGRVKTLHPAVFGGILARRGNDKDQEEMHQHRIAPIDLVVVDLYPFESALKAGADAGALIEKIDIGGVSLIRAAAKNYRDTLVVSQQAQYQEVVDMLRNQQGNTTLAQRHRFACAAFGLTARYDTLIASHFCSTEPTDEKLPQSLWPGRYLNPGMPTTALRYGENPHQPALFCGELGAMCTQLHGKALSYNNILDLDAGVGLVDEFEAPTFAIIKHGTPCGLASGFNLTEAWTKALACDSQSAFGGVLIANRVVDQDTAQLMDAIFFEVCLATDFTPEALETLSKRKNRILLRRGAAQCQPVTVRTALNGVLMQARDMHQPGQPLGECVTRVAPTPGQERDLLFACRAVKHCKSNAIALARDGQLIGVGAGETSRVDAVRHAIEKARANGHDPAGAVLASDAFFPFADSVSVAADAGVRAVVQPGGSIRDGESIAECDRLGLSMLLTGYRHFKH